MQATTIRQLEKALECKDDKELRLRVEVLLDMIKEQQPVFIPQTQPIQPTTYDIPKPTVTGNSNPKVNGAGSISSVNSEQITYRRPPNT